MYYPPIKLPCGGIAHFDRASELGHRCECGAMVGSLGQPRACQEEAEKWHNWEKLGGKKWDSTLTDAELEKHRY